MGDKLSEEGIAQMLEKIKVKEEEEAQMGNFSNPLELLSGLIAFGGKKQGLIDKNKFVFRGQGDERWPLTSKIITFQNR